MIFFTSCVGGMRYCPVEPRNWFFSDGDKALWAIQLRAVVVSRASQLVITSDSFCSRNVSCAMEAAHSVAMAETACSRNAGSVIRTAYAAAAAGLAATQRRRSS